MIRFPISAFIAIAAMVGVTGCGEDKKAQVPATLTIAIASRWLR